MTRACQKIVEQLVWWKHRGLGVKRDHVGFLTNDIKRNWGHVAEMLCITQIVLERFVGEYHNMSNELGTGMDSSSNPVPPTPPQFTSQLCTFHYSCS